MEVDLAVLVYGLTREAVRTAVEEAMAYSGAAFAGVWRVRPILAEDRCDDADGHHHHH
jgi:hypothetical protein